MARQNKPRSIGGESNLAERIAYERDVVVRAISRCTATTSSYSHVPARDRAESRVDVSLEWVHHAVMGHTQGARDADGCRAQGCAHGYTDVGIPTRPFVFLHRVSSCWCCALHDVSLVFVAMNTNQNEHHRVGATVKCLRELRGLTQDQLSSAALMSRSQLANIEAGRKGLGVLALARIAQALNVPAVAIKLPPVGHEEKAA